MAYAPTQKPASTKPSSAVDTPILRVPGVHRHRKNVSTGGGRAWSDAEVRTLSYSSRVWTLISIQETYLIETREHKMPYKHIAAQLKKTELACRLHYHQLSFGSKSRRTTSTASVASFQRSSTFSPNQTRHETPQRPLPSFSPPASPEELDCRSNETPHSTRDYTKPILPKPIPSPQRAAQETRQLRLVTDNVDHFRERQYVDIARLDRIYDAHRLHFWSTVARNYGCNLSPATLEDAWRQAHAISSSNFPPTPRGSPQSSQAPPSILNTPFSAVGDSGKGFTAINAGGDSTPKSASARPNSFAISSLLTENKEVRSPSREKKLHEVEMMSTQ